MSLTRLEQKKLDQGLKRLSKFGIDVQRWLAMLDTDDATMQRLATAWPVFSTPYAYDATAILGFGTPSEEPLPEAKSGEIIIRYGGWSLQELRDNSVVRGRDIMWTQDWYDKYPWSAEELPSGVYRLRIPVHASNNKTFAEQKLLLSSDEQTAPVVLVATALLAHHLQTGKDLLQNDFTRCKQTADGNHVVLRWDDGRLRVGDYWGGDPSAVVWLSSVRTS